MHAEFDHAKEKDVGGGILTSDEKPSPIEDKHALEFEDVDADGNAYPTEEELHTLRHVPYKLPIRMWLVCVIEFCERFCYYGVSGLFNNYISNPYGKGVPYTNDDLPGAIGRGSAFASGFQNYWQFWCYGGFFSSHSRCLRWLTMISNSHHRCHCRGSIPWAIQHHPDILLRLHRWSYYSTGHFNPFRNPEWRCSGRTRYRYDHHRARDRRHQVERLSLDCRANDRDENEDQDGEEW